MSLKTRFFLVIVLIGFSAGAQASSEGKSSRLPVKIVGKAYQALFHDRKAVIKKRVTRRMITSTAANHLGIPYHFGGKSQAGIDCSGFTKMVFKKNGIDLPHTTAGQAQYGKYIKSPFELQTGDLVFFETYKKGPSHVGIYIGKNEFIHASTGKGEVMKSKIDEEYYQNRFLGGKRLF